ncbi:uncharacterized protein LOC134187427 [Corticium candelabrum]|uniref:uncharacterized protein LOC134187427 n=1 Tax=Corticium candelabrum TaxID=121492 RepID=UPI002E26E011|nr:uncharacterized protein LOC134187427 [Corticium candelabrum]
MICLFSYFSELGSNRTIIRQNHRPEYFYWILAGTAIITTVDSCGVTHTQGIVTAGKSVDENALLLGKPRSHTITSQDKVSLLAMEKDDYIQHCHENLEKGEPSHIAYCRRVALFQDFNISVLQKSQETAVLHYFRRGTAIVVDSKQSEWLYIVKTGSCQVLQKVKQVKSNLANRQESHEDNPVEHEVEICNDESQSPKWSHSHISTQKAVDVSDKEIIDKTDVPLVMPHTNSEMTIIPKSAATKPSKSSSKTKSVFIQLDTLKPRDTFGFAELVFTDCPSVSLVSNGAECVMIRKRLFAQHMNHATKQRLLQEVKLYPPSDDLQQKLQDQANWEAFKQKTLTDVLVLSKCKSKEKNKHLFRYSFVDRQ